MNFYFTKETNYTNRLQSRHKTRQVKDEELHDGLEMLLCCESAAPAVLKKKINTEKKPGNKFILKL